tara:strand:- start:3156 stop:3638 length:483 start_codon:yes stop_codon:yes gene_type:complete
MIHGIYGSSYYYFYLTLEDQRINTAVSKNNIWHLFKFTHDLTKEVKYAYGAKNVHNDRYVKYIFAHNTTENIFTGFIDFKPHGYWKYEVYEISWLGTLAVNDTNAPNSETEVLAVHNDNGVVQGKVEEGKLLISETAGSEQVSYTKYTENDNTSNYLYTN